MEVGGSWVKLRWRLVEDELEMGDWRRLGWRLVEVEPTKNTTAVKLKEVPK